VIEGEFRDGAPRVALTVSGEDNSTEVEFVVDTGFTSYLAMPDAVLRSIGAITQGVSIVSMADGTYRRCPLYAVTVDWGDEERPVEAMALEDEPILGNRMMLGLYLQVEVKEGGSVVLEEL
jgi:clan AA aspartic protease